MASPLKSCSNIYRHARSVAAQEREEKGDPTRPLISCLQVGLLTNTHIDTKYGEDMTARRRTRSILHLGHDPP